MITEHYDCFNGIIMVPSKKCGSTVTVDTITKDEVLESFEKDLKIVSLQKTDGEPKPLKISKVNKTDNNNEPSDFVSIANKQIELYKKKNKDYGNATDILYKKHGFTYYQIMLEQKMQRIDSITNNNKEHNFESLEDSLLDLSNYALLAVESLRKEKQGK